MRKRELRLNPKTNAGISREVSNFNSFTILLLACFAATTKKETEPFFNEWNDIEESKLFFQKARKRFDNNQQAFINDEHIKPTIKELFGSDERKSFSENIIYVILVYLRKQFKFKNHTLYNSAFKVAVISIPLAIVYLGTYVCLRFSFIPLTRNVLLVISVLGALVFGLLSIIASRFAKVNQKTKKLLQILCEDYQLYDKLNDYEEKVLEDMNNENTNITMTYANVNQNFGHFEELKQNQHFKNLCKGNKKTEKLFQYLFEHSILKYSCEKGVIEPIDFPGYAITHFYYDKRFGYVGIEKRYKADFLALFGLEKLPKKQEHDGTYNKWDNLLPDLEKLFHKQ